MRHRRNGFTLIEVIVVVILLALLMSVAAPPFFRGLGWARMSGTARALVTMAKFARFHAIMYGRPVYLTVDIEGGRFVLEPEPSDQFLATWADRGLDTEGFGWTSDDGFAEEFAADPAGGEWETDLDEDGQPSDDGFLAGLNAVQPYAVPEHIRLDTYMFAESERLDADRATIVFMPNGTCAEFTLLMEDHRGKRLEVWFDPLTGQPEVYTPDPEA